ncbi:MAG: ribosomal RNA small subunit methyltransferase A [Candidatus Omnitrophica bacterium CG11_big_fil_rev_8_21_14_0_20_63_9]|nr:MAG: ribosomal RNA small subunit methyltransferase A [Candidatus Omnitrophica bacterium CG11_big_fil_rev_8_21_14_0_20_63_9]
MLTASALKQVLRERELRLSKRLGQHHLVDARAIERILEVCQLSPSDTVVEIGAGLGALTEPLARQAARVVAVEIDRRVAEVLAERMRPLANVAVQHRDILEFDWAGVSDVVVMGAIPYHITSPIIVALTAHRQQIRRAVLVVQEEVADRLAAQPGTKAYGRLSVLAQYGWQVAKRGRISRSAFFPQPTVDSCCLELQPHPQPPIEVKDEARFFEVVKAAFAQRRKTLVNSLLEGGALGVQRATIESALRQLGLSGTVRGEMLSLAQLGPLSNLLARSNSLS